jgi:hypothetical protein
VAIGAVARRAGGGAAAIGDDRAHREERPMTELPPLPAAPLGRYRHYKGGEYEVVGVARHSETLEPMVVYRPLYNDSGLWVRPYAMFVEQVDVAGALQPRFARVG